MNEEEALSWIKEKIKKYNLSRHDNTIIAIPPLISIFAFAIVLKTGSNLEIWFWLVFGSMLVTGTWVAFNNPVWYSFIPASILGLGMGFLSTSLPATVYASIIEVPPSIHWAISISGLLCYIIPTTILNTIIGSVDSLSHGLDHAENVRKRLSWPVLIFIVATQILIIVAAINTYTPDKISPHMSTSRPSVR